MKIEFSKRAVKVINRMDRPTQQRIKAALDGLCKVPPEGDIKALQGYSDGRQRCRVGQYRIVYKYVLECDTNWLYIMDIGSRGDIYK